MYQLLHNNKVYKVLSLNIDNYNILEEFNLLYVAITRGKKELLIQDKKYIECLKMLKQINTIKVDKIHFNNNYENFYIFEDFVIKEKEFIEFLSIIKN